MGLFHTEYIHKRATNDIFGLTWQRPGILSFIGKTIKSGSTQVYLKSNFGWHCKFGQKDPYLVSLCCICVCISFRFLPVLSIPWNTITALSLSGKESCLWANWFLWDMSQAVAIAPHTHTLCSCGWRLPICEDCADCSLLWDRVSFCHSETCSCESQLHNIPSWLSSTGNLG